MASIWRDCRFAARSLWKQPAFTLVAVLTLALGIAANTSIFSLVSTLMFKAPAIADPDRVVVMWHTTRDKLIEGNVSYLELQDWRSLNQTFESIAAYKPMSMVLLTEGRAERLQGLRVTANFLPFLKVSPSRGRDFQADEERRGAAPVALLSYEFWQNRFGGSDSAVGSRLDLNGRAFTVIGILPRSLEFPLARNVDVLTTIAEEGGNLDERGALMLLAVGRLKPGITFTQAQTDIARVADVLTQRYPQYNRNVTAYIVSLSDRIVGKDMRRALWLLFGTVAFILLIACTNVTNLMLVRAAGRQRELALRAALGAGRWQVIRELFVESLILSAVAGGAGLLATSWGLAAIKYYGRTQLPRIDEVVIDVRVLAFTIAASILTALLFSLLPVLKVSAPPLNEILKSGSRGATGDSAMRIWRDSLVVAEVALGFVLLVGAGLMIRSLTNLVNVNPGFDSTNVLMSRITMSSPLYQQPEARVRFVSDAMKRLEALPGVESAAFVAPMPFSGANVGSDFRIEGRPLPPPGQEPGAYNRSVTANYFQTIGIALKKGRYFNEQDRPGSVGAAIINETLERQNFAGENPIGARISHIGANQNEGDPEQYEIVGVVADVHHSSLTKPAMPELYLPFSQNSWNWGHMFVRASRDPATLGRSFTEAIQSVDGSVLVWGVQPLAGAIDDTTAQARFYTFLFGLFGASGLVLTLTGIYSVISYTVSQRMREVGIRIALGAETSDVLKLICGRGMFLAALGTVFGGTAAFVLTRWMANLLFELSPADVTTFGLITLLVISAALPACWIPARRATKADPTLALREE
jgi:putative ABC transport system permease protein